jgi:hypothetical protein
MAVLCAVNATPAAPMPRPAEPAVELRKETMAAFERYSQLTEARIEKELAAAQANTTSPFLRVAELPAKESAAAYEKLRRGEILIERLETRDAGKEIGIPHGMVHHWVGTVLVPGARLDAVLALVQDYDRHEKIYAPDVERSKLLGRDGDDFRALLRFRKKKVVTVVLNTQHAARYTRFSAARAASLSRTTRVAEVENPGAASERELPPGNDRGFLWHIYTYWRFEERDEGTYVQCESISLTRSIPALFAWLIKPFVTGVPRESLEFTLGKTRDALKPRP